MMCRRHDIWQAKAYLEQHYRSSYLLLLNMLVILFGKGNSNASQIFWLLEMIIIVYLYCGMRDKVIRVFEYSVLCSF